MSHKSLDSLIAFVQSKDRVCPLPPRWIQLWEMLPNRRHLPNGGWEPALPLILGAWWNTSAAMKRQRLREHLECASREGALHEVDTFLRSLREIEWAHTTDFM